VASHSAVNKMDETILIGLFALGFKSPKNIIKSLFALKDEYIFENIRLVPYFEPLIPETSKKRASFSEWAQLTKFEDLALKWAQQDEKKKKQGVLVQFYDF